MIECTVNYFGKNCFTIIYRLCKKTEDKLYINLKQTFAQIANCLQVHVALIQ